MIAALLRQASLLLPRNGLRPKRYVAFFSLLVSTGLRLSEACLTTCDVDLTQGVLTAFAGKFASLAWSRSIRPRRSR